MAAYPITGRRGTPMIPGPQQQPPAPAQQPAPGVGSWEWWFGPGSWYGQMTGQGQRPAPATPSFDFFDPPQQAAMRRGMRPRHPDNTRGRADVRAPGVGVNQPGRGPVPTRGYPNSLGQFGSDVPEGGIRNYYEKLAQGQEMDFDQFQSGVLGGYDALVGDYGGRESRIMDRIAGLGEQERQDIQRDYQRLGTRNQADLIGRGLGSSTILQGMRLGTKEKERDELGRLEERLRREQSEYDYRLSGDTLNAKAGKLGAQESLGRTGFEYGVGRDNQRLNLLMQSLQQQNTTEQNQLEQLYGAGLQLPAAAMGQDQAYIQYINAMIEGREDVPGAGQLSQFLTNYQNIKPPYVTAGQPGYGPQLLGPAANLVGGFLGGGGGGGGGGYYNLGMGY